MTRKNDLIKEMLIKHGATDIKPYTLVNNSGFTFKINGIKYDLRLWRNVYGVEANFYSVWAIDPKESNITLVKAINKEANEINNK